jgi:hypothetical protein
MPMTTAATKMNSPKVSSSQQVDRFTRTVPCSMKDAELPQGLPNGRQPLSALRIRNMEGSRAVIACAPR